MNPMTTGRIASGTVLVCLLLVSAAAAQTVQTNTLESLRSIFNSATTRISADTQRQRNEALTQYGKTLEDVLKTLKEKGDIETYAGVEEAYKRFKTEKAVMTNASETLVLNAVVSYQKQLTCVESNSTQRTASILRQYIAALNGLVKDLMARDKIEDAKAAGEVRRYAELYLAELLSRLQPDESRGEKTPPEAGGTPPLAASPADRTNPAAVAATNTDAAALGKKPVPPEASAYKGHHYEVFTDASNWDTAQFRCRTKGGHLVVIEDADENSYVYGLMQENDLAWIGAEKALGVWRWVSSKPFTYQNWVNSGEDTTSDRRVSYSSGSGMGSHRVRTIDGTKTRTMEGGSKAAMLGSNYVVYETQGKWAAKTGNETTKISAYICEWDY